MPEILMIPSRRYVGWSYRLTGLGSVELVNEDGDTLETWCAMPSKAQRLEGWTLTMEYYQWKVKLLKWYLETNEDLFREIGNCWPREECEQWYSWSWRS